MIRIEVKADRDLNHREHSALQALREATYPPETRAARPGQDITWAPPEWSALVWIDGALVSRVGLITRFAAHDGVNLMVGGVGGVMTHPESGVGAVSRPRRYRKLSHIWSASMALFFPCSSVATSWFRCTHGLGGDLSEGKLS